MLNAQTLIKKCLKDKDAVETYPFESKYEKITIMRHKSNNKWFAVIFEMENELCINLKCPPDLIPVLKEQFPAIKPAWHMNKKHWCMALVNKIPNETLEELINISLNLTAPKKSRKKENC